MKIIMLKDRLARMTALSVLFAVLFAGCEDVIQVDLETTEPRIVIEGHLSSWYNRSYFVISRTTDFYQPGAADRISGAIIVVADDRGFADTMFESESVSGRYENPIVTGRAGHSYQATVLIDNRIYEAITTMPEFIRIDSLGAEYQEGGGLGPEEDEGYRIHVYFTDYPGRPDYTWIRPWRNHVQFGSFYLYDGKFSDGNLIDYNYFFDVFQVGDTATVQMFSMEKKIYDYFLTLREVLISDDGSNSFDATPANPNTNWSGGALGYFGAFNYSFDRLIITE
jgi:hypothetical protein